MDTKERKRSTQKAPARAAGKTAVPTRKTTAKAPQSPKRAAATKPKAQTARKAPAQVSKPTGQRKRRPPVQTQGKTPVASRQSKTASRTQRRSAPRTQRKPKASPDVVYLPPKPFSRNRLLLRLATVVAVVLALVLGISVFFKVETVRVHGTHKYSADDILAASGIEKGANLLTFSRAKAGGKIIGTLPYVEKVRFGIKLPGTVNIEITEVEVGYAVADGNENWWLISAAGKVLEQLESGANVGHTNLLGVKLEAPVVGSPAQALEDQVPATDEEGNTIPIAVTAQKRLNTALNIVQYLEQNGIVGEAANVDVTEFADIRLQYGQRYRIELGDDSQLSYKISVLNAALADVKKNFPYSTGTLNVADPQNIIFNRDK